MLRVFDKAGTKPGGFRRLTAVALAGLLGGCAARPAAEPRDVVADPAYLAWAAFSPGSYAVVHHVTRTDGMAESSRRSGRAAKDTAEYDARYELTDLTDAKAEVTVTTTGGPARPLRQTVYATADRADVEAAPKPARQETLTIDGVAYACRVYEARTASGTAAKSSTVWVCPAVPGGVVKTYASQWFGPIQVSDEGMLKAVHAVPATGPAAVPATRPTTETAATPLSPR